MADNVPAPGSGAGGEHPAQGHESFLVADDFLWAKIALGVSVAVALVYALHDPIHGASGNTWLGYGLGTVGAGLMGWLAWLGVRKRQFVSGRGRARSWVSAHVYLGLALVVVVTLHTGFRLGWNIHTSAYVLMWLVVLSGLYGIAAYRVLPQRLAENRRDLSPGGMVSEIRRLDDAALRLADRIGPQVHGIVARSVASVRIGGTAWQQLTGSYPGRHDSGIKALADESRNLSATMMANQSPLEQTLSRVETVMFMADQLFEAGRKQQTDDVKRVLDMLTQRKALVERLNRDVTLRARLSVWLYLHVPLTIALLTAVVVHVVLVFWYL